MAVVFYTNICPISSPKVINAFYAAKNKNHFSDDNFQLLDAEVFVKERGLLPTGTKFLPCVYIVNENRFIYNLKEIITYINEMGAGN